MNPRKTLGGCLQGCLEETVFSERQEDSCWRVAFVTAATGQQPAMNFAVLLLSWNFLCKWVVLLHTHSGSLNFGSINAVALLPAQL